MIIHNDKTNDRYYLRAHHGVRFAGRALPVSHQTTVVSSEHRVQDRLAEGPVDRRLIGVVPRFGIGRVETIVETISPGPLAAVPGLAGRHLEVRQGDLVWLRTHHHLGSRQA